MKVRTEHVTVGDVTEHNGMVDTDAVGQPITKRADLPSGWCEYPHTKDGYYVNYSLRTATCSIFCRKQNEFWMIWTDIVPTVVFLLLLVVILSSDQIQAKSHGEIWMIAGLLVAVTLSRLCSTLYHVYNYVFVPVNHALINLDLIGFTCMTFGSPWLFFTANPRSTSSSGIIYLSIMGFLFALSLGIFGYLLVIEPLNSKLILLRQPLLICLAIIGNFPNLQIIFGPGFSSALRLLVAIGLFGLAIGYIGFNCMTKIPLAFLHYKSSQYFLKWHHLLVYYGILVCSVPGHLWLFTRDRATEFEADPIATTATDMLGNHWKLSKSSDNFWPMIFKCFATASGHWIVRICNRLHGILHTSCPRTFHDGMICRWKVLEQS
jgi:hypothetical protein